ncbi:MAG: 16S rRNA (guanine(527)-N(7))-methyltransferase RsmG [Henriciella sp.]|nr:16S rRNA (guanine(527)-N(7))-methyltransferase RsmG [Henriciella sp.]
MADLDGFGPNHLSEYVDVSRETLTKLQTVVDLLDAWRQRINLIGPAEMDHIWRRHVLDSLQLFPLISPDAVTVDLGSGSGFPGLVLAACLEHPAAEIVMIETVGKKCAYLRDVVDRVGLQASVRQARVETVKDVKAACVTARAFAPLPRLLDYASTWLDAGAYAIIPKGRTWQEELTQAEEYWTFAHEVIPSQSGGDGVILKISEVSRVDQ